MSENIECSMAVSKVNDVHTDERTVTVTLKGQKTITHDENGWEFEDIVEIELKLKCSMMKSAVALGVAEFLATKMLVLRDRDVSLESFGAVPVEVQQRGGVLADYEGIVPEDVLQKVESAIPDKILQSLA